MASNETRMDPKQTIAANDTPLDFECIDCGATDPGSYWIRTASPDRCKSCCHKWMRKQPTKGQPSMFTQGDDLPLFSQTPQRAQAEAFTPKPKAPQMSMFNCRACGDTGQIGDKKCWCKAA